MPSLCERLDKILKERVQQMTENKEDNGKKEQEKENDDDDTTEPPSKRIKPNSRPSSDNHDDDKELEDMLEIYCSIMGLDYIGKDSTTPTNDSADAKKGGGKKKKKKKKAGMPLSKLKEECRSNRQILGGHKDMLMARVMDGRLRGRLGPCMECFGGRLQLQDGA